MPTDKKPKAQVRRIQPKRQESKRGEFKFASVGSFTTTDDKGQIVDDTMLRSRIASIHKNAGFLEGGGGFANIADSTNMNYYNYEFPVDSLELPQSRPEELRYYRIAYDRDPVVARAIDLHTEIPMSKINLDKPKCSSEEFADYVFDYYQGLVNRTRLFDMFLHATREYWYIGEAFLYVEDDPDIDVCDAAKKEFDKAQKSKRVNPDTGRGSAGEVGFNAPLLEETLGLMQPKKSSLTKLSKLLKVTEAHVAQNIDRLLLETQLMIMDSEDHIAKVKLARRMGRNGLEKVAEDPPLPADPGATPTPDAGGEAPADGEGGDEPLLGAEGDGAEGLDGMSAPPSGGGGGGMNPLAGTPLGGQIDEALEEESTADPELLELRQYHKQLQKQKELLEELKTLKENRAKDKEIFKHVINGEYPGFDRIQLLPPENVEINVDPMDGPQIFFKPSERQKQIYLDSKDIDPSIKDNLEQNGTLPLNMDPMRGSYVIHFARKKAPFEPHGRSILQRCMRTILYRDKLRQVQTTLASRNMTPKTLIVAPGVGGAELIAIRAHIDEAKADPDYTVVVNYECTWNEIGSEGRLLVLDSEWQHTNQDLSAGLGFTPEILTGEGMYSNSRIQLEILNTTYLQFRDIISDIIENLIFKPIAMKKGFYEMDKYGRPRWIYPKVSFARMALRDSGDLYEMLYNLYIKGSVPIEIILEFLSIDPEACKRKLEEDLFTVNDSKFNDFLINYYSAIAQDPRLLNQTDIFEKMTKSMGLKPRDAEDEQGLEGTGEGIH
jgi:hypothetical protein